MGNKEAEKLSLAPGFSQVTRPQVKKTVSTVSFLVPFETISLDEKLKLLAEGLLAMVVFLVCDVGSHLIDV